MSLKIKYESLEDAQRRLKGTVVMYEGRPVYIREIGRGDPYRVYADNIPTRRAGEGEDADMRKYISSKNFDIAPFPMGYLNTDKGAFLCQRTPARMQQQGLSSATFSALALDGRTLPWTSFLKEAKVDDMVAGRYPTLREALASKVSSVAISREFCVAKDDMFEELCFLYHKNKKVAMVVDGTVRLAKNKGFLRESLVELGLRVA